MRREREPKPSSAARCERDARTATGFCRRSGKPIRINIIAECKRRSPSRGVLRAAYDPVALATGYAKAGAVALSILTEPTFFDGDLVSPGGRPGGGAAPAPPEGLHRRSSISCSRRGRLGADAVLLIVAALRPIELRRCAKRPRHSVWQRSSKCTTPPNSTSRWRRELTSSASTTGTCARSPWIRRHRKTIASRMPSGVIAVSESGLRSARHHRLRALGYHAFLIGERFMTTTDPGAALRELLRCRRPTGCERS